MEVRGPSLGGAGVLETPRAGELGTRGNSGRRLRLREESRAVESTGEATGVREEAAGRAAGKGDVRRTSTRDEHGELACRGDPTARWRRVVLHGEAWRWHGGSNPAPVDRIRTRPSGARSIRGAGLNMSGHYLTIPNNKVNYLVRHMTYQFLP